MKEDRVRRRWCGPAAWRCRGLSFEAAGDGDESLQVFAKDFTLRGKLRDLGERAEGRGFTCGRVEDGVLDGVEGGSGVLGQADADGVGAAVDDDGVVGGQAVEDCGGVFGDLSGREAEAAGDYGIDLEVGGRAGDGVVDAVLGVDYSGDLLDGGLHARAELVEEIGIVGEEFDDDVFGLVGEVADHVLEDLGELYVEGGLGFEDAGADFGHDLVDGAVALFLEEDGEVATVCLGDGGEAELQAGAAGGGHDLGGAVEDLLDVGEDAVGLSERGSGGGEVVEDEGAFVHLGQEVGAEGLVAEPGSGDQDEAGEAEIEWAAEEPGENGLVRAKDATHDGAVLVAVRGERPGGHPGFAEEEEREGGGPGDGQRKRGDERGGHGDSERAKEISSDSGDRDERQEDDDGGDGGEDQRRGDLAERFADGVDARETLVAMDDDVLDYDDRVVDDEANGGGEATESHEVEALSDDPEEEDGDGDGDGNDEAGDERAGPVAEEEEEDDAGEDESDEDRVADAADGLADELGLVVEGREMDAGWELGLEGGYLVGNGVGDLDGIPGGLARDVEQNRGVPLAVTVV